MSFLRFPSAQRRVLETAGLRVRGVVPAGYSAQLDCSLVALPYAGGQLQLLLLLPGRGRRFNANGLAGLEARLTPATWRQLMRSTVPQPVEVTVPLIAHRSSADLRAALQALGVSVAEETTADFSGVNGIRDLAVGGVVQLTEFHLGDGSVLHQGAHVEHGDHGDHGEHGHGHEDHGSHVGEKSAEYYIDHASHHDHGEHDEDSHVGEHHHLRDLTETGGRSSRTLWTVGPARLPWERPTILSETPTPPSELQLRQPHVEVFFERAFMYAVRHRATGAILISGRYLDPYSFV